MEDDKKLGATGEFPEGKLTEEDEGEIRLAIVAKDGNVVIHFGKPIAWVGLGPSQARNLASMIRRVADKIDNQKRKAKRHRRLN